MERNNYETNHLRAPEGRKAELA